MEKLEILIVEDKKNHLADAKEFFSERENIVNVAYATNLQEAENQLNQTNYGAVISDIFFPTGLNKKENQIKVNGLYQRLKEVINELKEEASNYLGYVNAPKEWLEGRTEAPCGIYVVEKAKEKKIPVVFNTDAFHHSDFLESVFRWAKLNEIGFVDVMGEGNPKEWKKAYVNCIAEIENIKNINFLDLKRLENSKSKLEKKKKEYPKLIQKASDENNMSYKKFYLEEMKEFPEIEKELKKCRKVIEKYKI